MTGTILTGALEQAPYFIYLPPAFDPQRERLPLLICAGSGTLRREQEMIFSALEKACREGRSARLMLVGTGEPENGWDYAPWPAPAAMSGQPDFTGGAGAYLAYLTGGLLPFLQRTYGVGGDRASVGLAGYSLAGLAALYGAYRTDRIGNFLSLSGSLWYTGWAGFMQSQPPLRADCRVYLSLGRAESRSRHPLMSQVGERTSQALAVLTRQLDTPPEMVWHDGGHFTQVPRRWLEGILWFGRVMKNAGA